MQTPPIAEELRDQSDRIIEQWQALVRSRWPTTQQHDHAALRDHVPELLDRMAQALSRSNGQSAGLPSDAAQKHGHQRATLDYSLEQVIGEYHLLERVIVTTLESRAPVQRRTLDVIHDLVQE